MIEYGRLHSVFTYDAASWSRIKLLVASPLQSRFIEMTRLAPGSAATSVSSARIASDSSLFSFSGLTNVYPVESSTAIHR